MSDRNYVAYVGSYTRGTSKGIHLFDVNEEYGSFYYRDFFQINNPSYLCMSKDEKYLYSGCDMGVAAFKIKEDGGLELLNKASVNGLRPCYISVDSKNRYLVTAGYHDGKLTVLSLKSDGSIGNVSDEVFMKGLGSVAGKNYRCHVNCAIFTPDEKYILAVDLGMDQVKIYEFNRRTGKLSLHDILRCELESGPKHMIFSAEGDYAYLTHENKSYVTQYAYDAKKVAFTKVRELSTLPPKYEEYNNAVTVKLSGNGRHLFVTNSGNNSVAIYRIDTETKEMETVCVLPISGEYPRDIVLFPDDKHFATANQEGDSLTCFKVNYDDGYIVMNGAPIPVPSPTCIVMKKIK